jgi:prepilin-type N-terminal cleavage/methylation domain-containing protein
VSSDDGFTLVELLFVAAIIALLAAIAVPSLIRARISGNETSALSSLRVVNIAQACYAASCGNDGFATSLGVLATRPAGATEAFLPAELAGTAPVKAGYQFSLASGAGSLPAPPDCNGTATQTAYVAAAIPQWYGVTGGRSFATSQTETIWSLYSGTAPAEPFGSPAVPIG